MFKQHYIWNFRRTMWKWTSAIDVSYVELVGTGGADLNNIINELNIIRQYKVAFDEALDMIYSGVAEKLLIEDENKW